MSFLFSSLSHVIYIGLFSILIHILTIHLICYYSTIHPTVLYCTEDHIPFFIILSDLPSTLVSLFLLVLRIRWLAQWASSLSVVHQKWMWPRKEYQRWDLPKKIISQAYFFSYFNWPYLLSPALRREIRFSSLSACLCFVWLLPKYLKSRLKLSSTWFKNIFK